MKPTRKTVVVAGATGLQGRAVTRHLLRDGWHVRALTRDPNSAQAAALARAGAQVTRARMEDIDSLTAAAEGAWGVFSVQPTVGSPGTPPDFTAEDEVRWGVNVAEASHIAGVGHFVFTSVAGADRRLEEKLPVNLVSKWRIEQHITALGLPATIMRPVSFILNEDLAYAGEWLNTLGYRADIPATRKIHPAAMDFATWLKRTGASQIAAFLDSTRTAGQDT